MRARRAAGTFIAAMTDETRRKSNRGKGVDRRAVRRASSKFRSTLIEMYGRVCFHCGAAITEDAPHDAVNRLTIEHLVPLGRGGGHDISNLRLACYPCNQAWGVLQQKPSGTPGPVLADIAKDGTILLRFIELD